MKAHIDLTLKTIVRLGGNTLAARQLSGSGVEVVNIHMGFDNGVLRCGTCGAEWIAPIRRVCKGLDGWGKYLTCPNGCNSE